MSCESSCNKLSSLITARNILPIRVTVTVGIVLELLMNEKIVFYEYVLSMSSRFTAAVQDAGAGFPISCAQWMN
jgi:hypothetical protein